MTRVQRKQRSNRDSLRPFLELKEGGTTSKKKEKSSLDQENTLSTTLHLRELQEVDLFPRLQEIRTGST